MKHRALAFTLVTFALFAGPTGPHALAASSPTCSVKDIHSVKKPHFPRSWVATFVLGNPRAHDKKIYSVWRLRHASRDRIHVKALQVPAGGKARVVRAVSTRRAVPSIELARCNYGQHVEDGPGGVPH
jgi:hypothetical protein